MVETKFDTKEVNILQFAIVVFFSDHVTKDFFPYVAVGSVSKSSIIKVRNNYRTLYVVGVIISIVQLEL